MMNYIFVVQIVIASFFMGTIYATQISDNWKCEKVEVVQNERI